jgi:hypothetical protein
MSRSSVHGCSTAERLSQLSESEILKISKNSRLDSSILSQRNANSLNHTVTAACRSLPYCDEAAKEARAKQVTQPVGYVGTLPAIRINESTAEWTTRDCYV